MSLSYVWSFQVKIKITDEAIAGMKKDMLRFRLVMSLLPMNVLERMEDVAGWKIREEESNVWNTNWQMSLVGTPKIQAASAKVVFCMKLCKISGNGESR